MQVAVVGCCHGELELLLKSVSELEKESSRKVDLIICCGDFQAVRNKHDLSSMTCPPKYQRMGSFYKYYSGELKCETPVLIIGGNHEASNHLLELEFGGWLAPNMYYLGRVGSVLFGGLRFCGVSGIFKAQDFDAPRFELCPLSRSAMYSLYHVRRLDVWRLCQLYGLPVAVCLSHDWPTHAWRFAAHSQVTGVCRCKRRRTDDFGRDMRADRLGNPALNQVLQQLQPRHWFAGHMHCRLDATVAHAKDEGGHWHCTQFSAFGKCFQHSAKFAKGKRGVLNGVTLMQIQVDSKKTPSTFCFEYDRQWLAILKSTHALVSFGSTLPMRIPSKRQMADGSSAEQATAGRWDYRPTAEEMKEIDLLFEKRFAVPSNFEMIADVCKDPSDFRGGIAPRFTQNPQTRDLLAKLQLEDTLWKAHEDLYRKLDASQPATVKFDDDAWADELFS